MRVVQSHSNLARNINLAQGVPRIMWPSTRCTDPFLRIDCGEISIFFESPEELNELFMAFAPRPEVRYLDA